MKALEVLKNRRIWAAIFAIIAFSLNTAGYVVEFDQENLIEASVGLIENISTIAAAFLSVWSYIKPKK